MGVRVGRRLMPVAGVAVVAWVEVVGGELPLLVAGVGVPVVVHAIYSMVTCTNLRDRVHTGGGYGTH